jgi:hypothetical protein
MSGSRDGLALTMKDSKTPRPSSGDCLCDRHRHRDHLLCPLARSNCGGSQNFLHASAQARWTLPSPISTPSRSEATSSKNGVRSRTASGSAVRVIMSSWRSVSRSGGMRGKVVGATAMVKWWRAERQRSPVRYFGRAARAIRGWRENAPGGGSPGAFPVLPQPQRGEAIMREMSMLLDHISCQRAATR